MHLFLPVVRKVGRAQRTKEREKDIIQGERERAWRVVEPGPDHRHHHHPARAAHANISHARAYTSIYIPEHFRECITRHVSFGRAVANSPPISLGGFPLIYIHAFFRVRAHRTCMSEPVPAGRPAQPRVKPNFGYLPFFGSSSCCCCCCF